MLQGNDPHPALSLEGRGSAAGGAICTTSANNLGAVSTGVWYFINAWHEAAANTCSIQVNDGAPNSANETAGENVADTAANLRIGAQDTTEASFFDGLIDEAAFYKRVLTAAERTWLYNSGAGRAYAEVSPPGLAMSYDGGHPHAVSGYNGNTYGYDANGNQTTRVIGGQTYTLGYDAEGHLVSVSGAATASFVYDGDGRRVKAVENGVTRLFAGAHYEFNDTTDEVTKYYFAGAQRVAVRKYIIPQTTSLNYLLGDHLGSTSLVTSDTGTLVTETRYKAWGEVRYTTPATTLPTRYTFTGQYSYVADEATDLGSAGFGLMFYNARWYDSTIGRFVQADSLIPSPGNSQAWDRYAYSANNSIRYNDPSGHRVCDETDIHGECMSESDEIKSAILEQNNRLARLVEKGKIDGVEAFAQLVEYADSLTPGCTKCLIQNVGAVLTGHSNGNYWRSELRRQYEQYYEDADSLGQGGYDPSFQDPAYGFEEGAFGSGGDAGNQAHHFWFYVQVGYESGTTLGNLGVIAHEAIIFNDPRGISYQDLFLGYEGVQLGSLMASGVVNASEVGNYIRQTLSQGSPTAMEYTDHVHDVLENGPWYPVIP